MFWPSMVVFVILAITPFVVATLMNRASGDALGDVEHLDPEVGATSGTDTTEEA